MPLALRRAGCALISAAILLVLAVPASAAPEAVGAAVKVSAGANGAQRLTYKIGPFDIVPGQNEIGNEIITQKPQVDGWITRIRPDLIYTSGKVPGVDVIHLHHGVWLNLGESDSTWPGLPERFVAAGEEKTIVQFPKGYGYAHHAGDRWLLNHMIHNLTPVPTKVYMVYEIDFIPASSPKARGIKPVRPIWMDVQNHSAYPVFNVEKGSGKKGLYTYPGDQPKAYGAGPRRNEWVADRDGVLVGDGGSPPSGRPLHRPLSAPKRCAAAQGELRDQEHRPGPQALQAQRAAGARQQRPFGPVEGQVLRARGGCVLGRLHDRHSPGLAREGPRGRHPLDRRDLRHQARRLVGVDGHHGRLDG